MWPSPAYRYLSKEKVELTYPGVIRTITSMIIREQWQKCQRCRHPEC